MNCNTDIDTGPFLALGNDLEQAPTIKEEEKGHSFLHRDDRVCKKVRRYESSKELVAEYTCKCNSVCLC